MSHSLLQAVLHVSLLGSSKKDNYLTEDVIQRHEMAAKSARVSKVLCEKQMRDLRKCYSAARAAFRARVHPFMGGIDVVVEGEMEALRVEMNKFQQEFECLKHAFIERWALTIEEEKADKGETFKESDYPSAMELHGKFAFEFHTLPLPMPNQIMAGAFTDEIKEKLKTEYEQRVENTRKAITRTTGETVLRLVAEVAETLADKDSRIIAGEKKKGVLARLEHYVERIPQLNVTNDPWLTNLYSEVKANLDVTANQVREDENLRELAAARALNISLKFGNMGDRKIAA